MIIDIDKLSEAELVDLNYRVVERLRFIQQARAHVSMLKFRIGERVCFEPEGRGMIDGVVARYNKKSVTVITSDGHRWNVAPGLLRALSTEESATVAGGDVIDVIDVPRR